MEELVFAVLFGIVVYGIVWGLAELCMCFDKSDAQERDESASNKMMRR